MKKIKKNLVLFLPFVLVSILFLILPLITIVGKSFFDYGSFSFNNYKNIFANNYYRQGIVNSLQISLISSLIGIVIDIFAAKAIHNSNGRGKRIFLNILNMTSNFQGIQLAFGFMLLFGNAGFVTLLLQKIGAEGFNIYSEAGLILIYVYFQIPMGTILLYPAFKKIKDEFYEVSALFDASMGQFYRYVALPIIAPDILGTFAILFSNALAAYAIAFALLGTNFPLIPVQISSMFSGDVTTNPNLGSAFSVILIVIMFVVNTLAINIKRRSK